ncbi:MAG: ribbon-helix-helix protein, CopG family [Methanomicrobiales archaeon]|nr:ribbon-helix-helix protein, CopG family [Methanomicrobiales archaeon]
MSAVVSQAMLEDLDRIAAERNLSRSGAVRSAIEEFIERDKRNVCVFCGSPNRPGSRYCCFCGRAITREGAEEIDEALRGVRETSEYQKILRILRRDLGLE